METNGTLLKITRVTLGIAIFLVAKLSYCDWPHDNLGYCGPYDVALNSLGQPCVIQCMSDEIRYSEFQSATQTWNTTLAYSLPRDVTPEYPKYWSDLRSVSLAFGADGEPAIAFSYNLVTRETSVSEDYVQCFVCFIRRASGQWPTYTTFLPPYLDYQCVLRQGLLTASTFWSLCLQFNSAGEPRILYTGAFGDSDPVLPPDEVHYSVVKFAKPTTSQIYTIAAMNIPRPEGTVRPYAVASMVMDRSKPISQQPQITYDVPRQYEVSFANKIIAFTTGDSPSAGTVILQGDKPSIDLDSVTHQLSIAFCRPPELGTPGVYLSRFNGSAWVTESSPAGPTAYLSVVCGPELKFDNAGFAKIAYFYTPNTSTVELRVAFMDLSSWVQRSVLANPCTSFLGMVIDPASTMPYVLNGTGTSTELFQPPRITATVSASDGQQINPTVYAWDSEDMYLPVSRFRTNVLLATRDYFTLIPPNSPGEKYTVTAGAAGYKGKTVELQNSLGISNMESVSIVLEPGKTGCSTTPVRSEHRHASSALYLALPAIFAILLLGGHALCRRRRREGSV